LILRFQSEARVAIWKRWFTFPSSGDESFHSKRWGTKAHSDHLRRKKRSRREVGVALALEPLVASRLRSLKLLILLKLLPLRI
jgi:hypothetical protein